jgi:hypothetical protein
VLAAAIAAALLSGVFGTSGRAATEARSCARGDIAAVVDGVARCLRDGQRCDHFLDRTYHRYAFHCHGLLLETEWRPFLRPLHLPTLAPGSPCPKTIGRLRTDEPPPYGSRALLGPGPAYPIAVSRRPFDPTARDAVLYAGPAPSGIEGAWYHIKIGWFVSPSYHGPLVIRGRQLDGPGALRFVAERTNEPDRLFAAVSLRLPGGPGFFRNGWRGVGGGELFSGAGCYGFQVDGRTFSRTIVLQIAVE